MYIAKLKNVTIPEKPQKTILLSLDNDFPTSIENGQYAGMKFSEMLKKEGKKILGNNALELNSFTFNMKILKQPIVPSLLIEKVFDVGGVNGWYISESSRGGYIYYGLKEEKTKQEIKKHIAENKLEEILNKVNVKKGDFFFFTAGTIYAAGKGLEIIEVSQSGCDVLNVSDKQFSDKIFKAVNTYPCKNPIVHSSTKERLHLANCPHFITDRVLCNGQYGLIAAKDSFVLATVIEGESVINGMDAKKGDCFFIPAGFGRATITGNCTILESRI